MAKWALIHLGSDIAYGMAFFANDLVEKDQTIHWYDGDENLVSLIDKLKVYSPDYVCFGPLSSESVQAEHIATHTKIEIPTTKTVFGGHHANTLDNIYNTIAIDYLVKGPCYGAIDNILSNSTEYIIEGKPKSTWLMTARLEEYYQQVPRMAKRPRTYIMSHFGCCYNCHYCNTGKTRNKYRDQYKKSWLTRRPIHKLIKEALIAKKHGIKEIALADDDCLYKCKKGQEGTIWWREFYKQWAKIDLPIYCNVTPISVLKASEDTILDIATVCDTVQMGYETYSDNSKKLFNRSFQTEEQVIAACKRLGQYGIKIKLEIIVGLPNINELIPDPVEDAIQTIMSCQRIVQSGKSKHPELEDIEIKAQCYPLILYPGTKLYDMCEENNISTVPAWKNSFYEGLGSVVFDKTQSRNLQNIIKMTTMFVKYNINRRWMEALIDMKLTDTASRKLSECNYRDSITFRLNDITTPEFNDIIKDMAFKY